VGIYELSKSEMKIDSRYEEARAKRLLQADGSCASLKIHQTWVSNCFFSAKRAGNGINIQPRELATGVRAWDAFGSWNINFPFDLSFVVHTTATEKKWAKREPTNKRPQEVEQVRSQHFLVWIESNGARGISAAVPNKQMVNNEIAEGEMEPEVKWGGGADQKCGSMEVSCFGFSWK
jgi:hypothetical protein